MIIDHLTLATLLFLSITMAFAQISSSIASHFRRTCPTFEWKTCQKWMWNAFPTLVLNVQISLQHLLINWFNIVAFLHFIIDGCIRLIIFLHFTILLWKVAFDQKCWCILPFYCLLLNLNKLQFDIVAFYLLNMILVEFLFGIPSVILKSIKLINSVILQSM